MLEQIPAGVIKKGTALKLIIFTFLVALLSAAVFAIPNTISLQGRLTNSAGVATAQTVNVTFTIYDAPTGGSMLYQAANQLITTDANGVFDTILDGLNLSFADQYYLGLTVGTDPESVPRINLTSSPYAFRANTSEALNPAASYTISSLTAGNITATTLTTTNLIILGNATNLSITSLNVNGSLYPALDATFDVGNSSLRWRNAAFSGIINAGTINAASVTVNGNDVQLESNSFKLSNFTISYDARLDRFGNANFTALYDARADRFGIANYTALENSSFRNQNFTALFQAEVPLCSGTDKLTSSDGNTLICSADLSGAGDPSAFNLVNYSNEYASTGYKLANFTANYDARLDRFGNANFTALLANLGNTNINSSGNLTIFGNVVISQLANCDTIDTNANGLLACGVDATGSGTQLNGMAINVTNLNASGQVLLATGQGNVGIGTITPAEKLVVIGNVNISGTLNVSGRVSFASLANCDTIDTNANGVLSCGIDAAGAGTSSPWNSTGTNVYLNDTTALVGIGISTPAQKLDVVGQVHSTGNICTDASGGVCLGNVSSLVGSSINASLNWTQGEFCILMKAGACPSGFTAGFLGLSVASYGDQASNGTTGNSRTFFSGANTVLELYLCCK